MWVHSKAGRVVVIGCLASMVSCTSSAPPRPRAPVNRVPTYPVLEEMRQVREEWLHPARISSQGFAWNKGTPEWSFYVGPEKGSFVGYSFRKPLDVSRALELLCFCFKTSDGHLLEDLELVLVTGNRHEGFRLVSAPLVPHRVGPCPVGSREYYAVPLRAFPGEAITLPDQPRGPVNWQCVSGIRIRRTRYAGSSRRARIHAPHFGPQPRAYER